MLLNISASEEYIEWTDCEAELNKSGTVSEWGNVKQRFKDYCSYLQGMGWPKGGGGVIMVTAIKLCCTWEYFQFVWNEGDVQDDMMN